jgi:hypothetical protein
MREQPSLAQRGRRPWVYLTGLWLITIVAFVLNILLGYFERVQLTMMVILAAWVSAIAVGSRRALQAARRVIAPLEHIRSRRPAARALLAIFIGAGVVVLGKVINQ